MKLLVFGKTGQVARELGCLAAERGLSARLVGRDEIDLTHTEGVRDLIARADAGAVLNAAAYTAVDLAETERDAAFAVNAAAPAAMARAAALRGLPFVHVSTDFVFDGAASAPYREDAIANPLSVYGASKREGEVGVLSAGGVAAILRTSWVFSVHGKNFVKTMLRLAADRPAVKVVADQRGKPTPARAVAEAMIAVAHGLAVAPEKAGLYHVAGAAEMSWADFARAIFAQAGFATVVEDIPTSGYPTPARRPAYSVLDCTKIEREFGVAPAPFSGALRSVIGALANAT